MMWERQTHRWWETKTDCHLQGLMYSLPMRLTQTVLARRLLAPTPVATVLYLPTQLISPNWDWLKTKTPVSHMGICIYHFITPTHFRSTTWLLPVIFTGASWAENLWLTAQSRANINNQLHWGLIIWLVDWLVSFFNGISTLMGY